MLSIDEWIEKKKDRLQPLQRQYLEAAEWFVFSPHASGKTHTLCIAILTQAAANLDQWIRIWDHNSELHMIQYMISTIEYLVEPDAPVKLEINQLHMAIRLVRKEEGDANSRA